MRPRVLRAVQDDGVGGVDLDAEDVALQMLVLVTGPHEREYLQPHIRTTLSSGEEAREEPAVVGRDAGLRPCPLDDAVVSSPEAELEDVALADLDRVGLEGEAEAADGDGDCRGAGLQGHAGRQDERCKHGFYPGAIESTAMIDGMNSTGKSWPLPDFDETAKA